MLGSTRMNYCVPRKQKQHGMPIKGFKSPYGGFRKSPHELPEPQHFYEFWNLLERVERSALIFAVAHAAYYLATSEERVEKIFREWNSNPSLRNMVVN